MRLSLSLGMHRHARVSRPSVLLTDTQQPRTVREHRYPGPGAHAYQEAITLTTEPMGSRQARALADVDRDYPGWHAWPATLAGLVYARRPMSSPPMVVRAVTVGQLRTEIEAAEAERGLR